MHPSPLDEQRKRGSLLAHAAVVRLRLGCRVRLRFRVRLRERVAVGVGVGVGLGVGVGVGLRVNLLTYAAMRPAPPAKAARPSLYSPG